MFVQGPSTFVYFLIPGPVHHASPELVAKLERLRQRVVELGRDNVRLKEILNKRMNIS